MKTDRQSRILKHHPPGGPYPTHLLDRTQPLRVRPQRRAAQERIVTAWLPKRPNLLLVNRGPVAVDFEVPVGRSWDWAELFFRKEDVSDNGQDAILLEINPNYRKLGVIRLAELHGAPIGAYERVILADDDVVPAGCTWDDVLALFAETGARVGAPSIAPNSEGAHPITFQDPTARWRRTNFMDLQAICMTRAAYAAYAPVFCDTMHLWGVERLFAQREGGVVLLDETPVRHRRPAGSSICYKACDTMGDYRRFLAKHRLVEPPHEVLERVAKRKVGDGDDAKRMDGEVEGAVHRVGCDQERDAR